MKVELISITLGSHIGPSLPESIQTNFLAQTIARPREGNSDKKQMGTAYFKLIHLLAVIIFLGNIITGLFWMRIAVKTKDLRIIHHTMNGIIIADRYFTIPGVIVITVGGFLAAIYGHFPLLRTGWILWSIILFSISGVAFAFKIAPLQRKIYNLTSGIENPAGFDWINFHKIYFAWDVWGLIAVLTPLGAFVMMTLKIPQ